MKFFLVLCLSIFSFSAFAQSKRGKVVWTDSRSNRVVGLYVNKVFYNPKDLGIAKVNITYNRKGWALVYEGEVLITAPSDKKVQSYDLEIPISAKVNKLNLVVKSEEKQKEYTQHYDIIIPDFKDSPEPAPKVEPKPVVNTRKRAKIEWITPRKNRAVGIYVNRGYYDPTYPDKIEVLGTYNRVGWDLLHEGAIIAKGPKDKKIVNFKMFIPITDRVTKLQLVLKKDSTELPQEYTFLVEEFKATPPPLESAEPEEEEEEDPKEQEKKPEPKKEEKKSKNSSDQLNVEFAFKNSSLSGGDLSSGKSAILATSGQIGIIFTYTRPIFKGLTLEASYGFDMVTRTLPSGWQDGGMVSMIDRPSGHLIATPNGDLQFFFGGSFAEYEIIAIANTTITTTKDRALAMDMGLNYSFYNIGKSKLTLSFMSSSFLLSAGSYYELKLKYIYPLSENKNLDLGLVNESMITSSETSKQSYDTFGLYGNYSFDF